MEALVIALVTVANILIIKWKLEHKRFEDALFDGGILVVLVIVSGGTLGGLIISTITSFIISLSFLVSPPRFLPKVDTDAAIKRFKEGLPR